MTTKASEPVVTSIDAAPPQVIASCSRDGTTKKPGHAGWPGLGAAQEARGLGIPHVITGCAVASVQPCRWGGGSKKGCDDPSGVCDSGRATLNAGHRGSPGG